MPYPPKHLPLWDRCSGRYTHTNGFYCPRHELCASTWSRHQCMTLQYRATLCTNIPSHSRDSQTQQCLYYLQYSQHRYLHYVPRRIHTDRACDRPIQVQVTFAILQL
jgi:hypothetical protein